MLVKVMKRVIFFRYDATLARYIKLKVVAFYVAAHWITIKVGEDKIRLGRENSINKYICAYMKPPRRKFAAWCGFLGE